MSGWDRSESEPERWRQQESRKCKRPPPQASERFHGRDGRIFQFLSVPNAWAQAAWGSPGKWWSGWGQRGSWEHGHGRILNAERMRGKIPEKCGGRRIRLGIAEEMVLGF